MRRVIAVLCILIGTTLFGVAAGYVYMDQREIQIGYIQAMGGERLDDSDLLLLGENEKSYIARAMLVGPPGAGLLLAGLALMVMELRWFRPVREGEPR